MTKGTSTKCDVSDAISSWKEEENVPFTGWDFTHIASRFVAEPPPWSYEDMARELMSSSLAALDLGTGGGEFLRALKGHFPKRIVATEDFPPNLTLARERLEPLGIEVVGTEPSSLKQKLPFTDGEFDLVIDRHTCFNASEVARILTPGGIFLTEQVDGRNLDDLLQAFESKPQWPFFTLDFALSLIKSAGLKIDIARDWTGKAVFRDVGAIVYYLKAVPWTVPDFTVKTHCKYLLKLQKQMSLEGEIAYTQKLHLIKAKKI
jgi:SAM-dependent methyltransferase